MAKVDYQAILIKVAKSDKLRVESLKLVDSIIKKEKQILLNDFDSHKITKEIDDGPSTNNSSGLLPGLQRGGNLFSFIGFEQGSDPLAIIRKILSTRIAIGNNRRLLFTRFARKNTIEIGVEIQYPSLDELYEATPYPDEYRDGSWLEGISKGLTGLQSYIYDDDGNFEEYGSRSSTGLQAKTKGGKLITVIRDKEAKSDKTYITKMLGDLAKRLRAGV